MPRRLDAFVLPGKFLVDKIAELKKQQQEQSRRKVTERELAHLHHKIDKLLIRLEENEPEPALSPDEECAICISAKATMQTFPCGHRVVCRKCFVKTIQMAVSQRLLPLRCVICRAKILKLKQHSSGIHSNQSQQLQGGHQQPTITTTEDMPRLLSSAFQERITNNSELMKTFTASEIRKLRRRKFKKSHMLPPSTSSNPSASRRRHYCFGESKSRAFLLPIPELEELKIVRAVQQPELCDPELTKKVWSPKDEVIKKVVVHGNPNAKKKQDLDKRELPKWWSRLRSLKPPAILKVIKKKLKQH